DYFYAIPYSPDYFFNKGHNKLYVNLNSFKGIPYLIAYIPGDCSNYTSYGLKCFSKLSTFFCHETRYFFFYITEEFANCVNGRLYIFHDTIKRIVPNFVQCLNEVTEHF